MVCWNAAQGGCAVHMSGGCNPLCWRLQTYVREVATFFTTVSLDTASPLCVTGGPRSRQRRASRPEQASRDMRAGRDRQTGRDRQRPTGRRDRPLDRSRAAPDSPGPEEDHGRRTVGATHKNVEFIILGPAGCSCRPGPRRIPQAYFTQHHIIYTRYTTNHLALLSRSSIEPSPIKRIHPLSIFAKHD